MTVACTINVYFASSSVALALSRSVNYNRKVHYKLKRTFTIGNYDHNTFML